MIPNKGMPFTRAQKIMNKIISQSNRTHLNIEDENQNENNITECPVSPLPSGAEYAVEDLSFDIFAHTDLQLTRTIENDAQTPVIDDIEPIICNTPIPSPALSFSAYSNTVENNLENLPFANSDYLTSTPELAEPIGNDNLYEHPSSIISSDIQPSVSEPASMYSSSDVFSPSLKNRNKRYTKRKDIGRIRQRYQKEWVDMKRKRLKNLGLQYQSRDGKLRHAKSLGDIQCYPKCVYKCFEKFTNSQRQKIFDKFWAIGDHSKQWSVLARYIQKTNKRRTVTDSDSRRTFTYIYYLPVLDSDNNIAFGVDNEEKHRVCKTTFLKTFVVSEKVIRTAIAKHSSELASTDQRGHHKNHPVVTTDAMIESVLDHVKSYVPVESHYCRKDSSKLYLDGSLTFRRMFTMYKEWFDPNKYPSRCGSMRQYRDIVNKNVNVGFHKPKKDLCDTCHVFKNSPDPNEDMKLAYTTHISNKNIARSLKSEDKKQAALSRTKIFCACYDMQKILYCPQGDVSLFYYKMKLKLYNFTAFDIDKLQGFCYLWSEQHGKKGPNEIASFVYDLIVSKSKEGYCDFRFWSDNCSSQNRNRIVFCMYLYASKKFNINIKHTYLEKEHTQSEVDSVHATIEKAAKNKIIYTPNEWNALIRWSKQTGEAYTVTDVTQDMILDFKKMQRSPVYNWTKTTNGDQVKWSKIKQVMISNGTPDTLTFKYDLAEDATEYVVDVQSKQKKTRQTRLSKQTNVPAESSLTKCYNGLLPITEEKKKDLMSMCNAKVIPVGYHAFFSNLTVSSSAVQVADLSSDEE